MRTVSPRESGWNLADPRRIKRIILAVDGRFGRWLTPPSPFASLSRDGLLFLNTVTRMGVVVVAIRSQWSLEGRSASHRALESGQSAHHTTRTLPRQGRMAPQLPERDSTKPAFSGSDPCVIVTGVRIHHAVASSEAYCVYSSTNTAQQRSKPIDRSPGTDDVGTSAAEGNGNNYLTLPRTPQNNRTFCHVHGNGTSE